MASIPLNFNLKCGSENISVIEIANIADVNKKKAILLKNDTMKIDTITMPPMLFL
jgi:hypothetical protein